MKPIIYPWKMQSKSAKLLAKAIPTKRVYADRDYRHLKRHVVVNWGSTKRPSWLNAERIILNHPDAVALAVNKLTMYNILYLNDIPTLTYTTNKELAYHWVSNRYLVYCRTVLNGSGGKGIVLAKTQEELVDAPVYTLYIPFKFDEFRVHVFQEEIIDITQKKRKRGVICNEQIRSHGNGWVFARTGVELSEECQLLAVDAINAFNLDFGAVDIAVSKTVPTEYCVIEVNTAPGLVNTTLEKYVDKIKSFV